MISHQYQDLIKLFNQLFSHSEDTVLVAGSDEPLYLPKSADYLRNQVFFRYDYYASALHEIAHWCIAGDERRKLVDYGYWYKPDGRVSTEQDLFEQVEAKPQAIEWIFSQAAGVKFRVSADNLSSNQMISNTFKLKIYNNAQIYLQQGLPQRAEEFKKKLLHFYQREQEFQTDLFQLNFL